MENVNAIICVYGNREMNFAYLVQAKGVEGVFGNYEAGAKRLSSAEATFAVWGACQELRARGIWGKAIVEYQYSSAVIQRAEIEIDDPGYWGSLKWKCEIVDA